MWHRDNRFGLEKVPAGDEKRLRNDVLVRRESVEDRHFSLRLGVTLLVLADQLFQRKLLPGRNIPAEEDVAEAALTQQLLLLDHSVSDSVGRTWARNVNPAKVKNVKGVTYEF